MNKFFDFEILGYIALIVVSFIVLSLATNHTKKKCIEAGGQIVTYTTKLDTACVYPVKPVK